MTTVYLAGPVEQSDDPRTWREEIKKNSEGVDLIDPVEMYSHMEPEEFGDEDVWHLLRSCAESDAMIVYADNETRTWGTPIEQFYAHYNGVRVYVVRNDEDSEKDPLPSYMKTFSHEVCKDTQRAVRQIRRYFG